MLVGQPCGGHDMKYTLHCRVQQVKSSIGHLGGAVFVGGVLLKYTKLHVLKYTSVKYHVHRNN